MTLNVTSIKDALQSLLTAANTTTAAYDLSAGLTQRVNAVMTVHPGKIPIQASYYPYVTIFCDRKDISLESVSINQLAGRRSAEVALNIVGGVWETQTIDVKKDKSDSEIEKLMENVEELVRRDHTIGGTVLWTRPMNIEYHTVPYGEETILRVAVLNLVAKAFY